MSDYMNSYSSQNTAILIVDPFNDFLSEGGKRWSKTKETVKGVNLIEKLKSILSSARSFGIKIVYVPHHQTEKGDYLDWKFRAPSHQGCLKYSLFEKGSWGGEFHPELLPKEGDLIAQNHWTASGFANTNLDFLLKQHNIDHVVIVGIRASTCIDTTARYAVELGYHTTLLKDAIAAYSWEEIKATVEVNFPAYGHTLLSTEEFINTLNTK
ncbi:MAG: isochorismatase family cysteine hydrolase [Candidatus Nitrosopolaris sp.]